MYLVAAADSPVPATVTVHTGKGGPTQDVATEDVATDGTMSIGSARLYHLVHLPAAAQGTVTVTFSAPGVRLYAFTFGG